MEKAEDIGSFFFRAHSPETLKDWHKAYLGLNPVPAGPDDFPWVQSAG